MGGRLDSDFSLKGIPSVIVVMGKWRIDSAAEIIGVFGGEDRQNKAADRVIEALGDGNGETDRFAAWIVGDFFVQ